MWPTANGRRRRGERRHRRHQRPAARARRSTSWSPRGSGDRRPPVRARAAAPRRHGGPHPCPARRLPGRRVGVRHLRRGRPRRTPARGHLLRGVPGPGPPGGRTALPAGHVVAGGRVPSRSRRAAGPRLPQRHPRVVLRGVGGAHRDQGGAGPPSRWPRSPRGPCSASPTRRSTPAELDDAGLSGDRRGARSWSTSTPDHGAVDRGERDRLAADHGDATVLLFVGRISPNKAHERLVEALWVYRRLYDPRCPAPPRRPDRHAGVRRGRVRLRRRAGPGRRRPPRRGADARRSWRPGTRTPTSSCACPSTRGSASRCSRRCGPGRRSWRSTPARWARPWATPGSSCPRPGRPRWRPPSTGCTGTPSCRPWLVDAGRRRLGDFAARRHPAAVRRGAGRRGRPRQQVVA